MNTNEGAPNPDGKFKSNYEELKADPFARTAEEWAKIEEKKDDGQPNIPINILLANRGNGDGKYNPQDEIGGTNEKPLTSIGFKHPPRERNKRTA